jgi:ATP-dependent DNA helicase RecG
VKEGRIPGSALNQSITSILENLRLMQNNVLNNAAVVLFGTELERNYYQCLLKVARFKGVDKHEFIDSGRLHGNIFNLLEYGMSFLRKHLPIAARIEPGKMERVETPLIPFNAIREALINALCHKDYSSLGGDIGLAIYDDRMEIANHGGLLPGVTIEKIKSGFSSPRNEILAGACYKFCIIENWGRGIQEIINSCMNAGDPEPEFFSDSVEFKVIFRFPRNIGPEIAYLSNPAIGLSERQKEIIDIIAKEYKITANEINSKLLKPVSERTMRYDLAAIKDLGLVSSSGNTKKNIYMLANNSAIIRQ